MCRHFNLWASRLHAEGLDEMAPAGFAQAVAEPWGEKNVVYLCREGNTRAQVAFLTYFANAHGLSLGYSRFSADIVFRHKFNAG